MSNEPAKNSIKGPASAEIVSVFDFLYHDPQRIGSFLAQLDPNGHMQSMKNSSSTAESRSSKLGGQGGGGVLPVKAAFEGLEGQDVRQGSEKTYDPLWTNARNFLDYLHQRRLICRGVENASIGSFVLEPGELSILDVTLLKGAWAMPSIRSMILSGADGSADGNRKQRRATESRPRKSPEGDLISTSLDLLGLLPHSVQARISNRKQLTWASLKEDCLVTSSSDLTLKHGVVVPGEWQMLGILDARPDDDETFLQPDPSLEIVNGVASMMVSSLAPVTRATLGRPGHAYGMTPLLIFREIAAAPALS